MTDLFEIDAPTTTTSLELRRLQRDQRRRQRRLHSLVAATIGIVVLAIGVSIAFNFVQTFKSSPNSVADYPGAGQGVVLIVINEGDNGATIAKTLKTNDVVASEKAFLLATYANPDAAMKIQPGYYLMQKQMKAEYALQELLNPDRKKETNITIPEGFTEAKILDKVASVTGYTLDEVTALAADTQALGLPAEAKGNLEGWLFPATYKFNPDVHPADVLQAMIKKTVSVLTNLGVPQDKWETTLTFASLVEREARLDADRPLIASVIQNRLSVGQALELDSTILYFSPADTTEARASDNPYNTYKFIGLPPGPIASPGQKSIEAALKPATTGYFYFVTINLETGETRYAATYPDHLKNVALYQAWVKANS